MGRIALAGSLLFVSATLAHAQVANEPIYAVGDTWTYTERSPQLGTVAEVVKVADGGRRVMVRPTATCPKCQWVYGRDLVLIEVLEADGKPADPSAFGFLGIGMKFFDFPLEVKKAWRTEGYGLNRGSNVQYTVECVVSGFKDVKTKAGTFKAFQIDRSWRIKVSSGPSPNWSDTIWWSPEVKNAVKFESGARNAQNWELISYTLKP